MPLGDPKYPLYAAPMFTWVEPGVDVSPAIAGVLKVLPHPGTPWPDVEKAKFMAALGAVLDLVYPPPDLAQTKVNQR